MYALEASISIAVVVLFFTIRVAVSLRHFPFAGRASDCIGYLLALAAGMVIVGEPLFFLSHAQGNAGLLLFSA